MSLRFPLVRMRGSGLGGAAVGAGRPLFMMAITTGQPAATPARVLFEVFQNKAHFRKGSFSDSFASQRVT